MSDYWDYLGATEEALLAAEAIGHAKAQFGTTFDERRCYRITEVDADGRPFRITFDAVGGPVAPEEIKTLVSVHHHFPIVRDLLAALVHKVQRTPLAYLCRGCDEIDPLDRHDDWHVVVAPAHDPNDPHLDGCTNCPIEVQEQCGPVVRIGDVDNSGGHERLLLARSRERANGDKNRAESDLASARSDISSTNPVGSVDNPPF